MRYLDTLGLEAFVRDDMRHRAVVRCLDVIGEAARALSADVKARHPQLP